MTKTLTLRIENCEDDCPYWCSSMCDHPDVDSEYNECPICPPVTIPDWCPLEEAKVRDEMPTELIEDVRKFIQEASDEKLHETWKQYNKMCGDEKLKRDVIYYEIFLATDILVRELMIRHLEKHLKERLEVDE